jgi:CheY-like chemotaxis protein
VEKFPDCVGQKRKWWNFSPERTSSRGGRPRRKNGTTDAAWREREAFMNTRVKHMTLSEALVRLRHPRLLLAEDDVEMRALLVRHLRQAGFEVTPVASGDEALDQLADAILSEQHFELVIADIRMPGCSGLHLLAGVRKRDWHMPVILITAFGNSDTHHEARRLGAYAVFDKPFDFDDLKTAALNAAPLGAY